MGASTRMVSPLGAARRWAWGLPAQRVDAQVHAVNPVPPPLCRQGGIGETRRRPEIPPACTRTVAALAGPGRAAAQASSGNGGSRVRFHHANPSRVLMARNNGSADQQVLEAT